MFGNLFLSETRMEIHETITKPCTVVEGKFRGVLMSILLKDTVTLLQEAYLVALSGRGWGWE